MTKVIPYLSEILSDNLGTEQPFLFECIKLKSGVYIRFLFKKKNPELIVDR